VLPDQQGLQTHEEIRRCDPHVAIIVVTGHSSMETVIDAMKRGAFDFLVKPVEIDQLCTAVAKAIHVTSLHRLTPREALTKPEGPAEDVLVGNSPPMQKLYKAIGRVAHQDVNVLLLGESGTGKELVARSIHQHSSRARQAFVPVNCACLTGPLLESELFGHERGAFTGAEKRRLGKFEQAHGGTLFLDEIGDMDLNTQAK